jgi:hypothetical protein
MVTVSGGLASNPAATVFSGLASKPVRDSFLQFDLKTGGDGFSRFGLKTGGRFHGSASKPILWFGDLGLIITVTVSWFGPKNHAGFGLSVALQNRWRVVGAGHVSRSSSLLHVEASLARVS